MHAEGVERIVIAELAFHDDDGDVGNDSGDDTDDHRALGGDKTRSGSDHHQAGDGTGAEAEDGRLALVDLFDQRPTRRWRWPPRAWWS